MQGVIQRAYNAFAIRVHGVAPPTPGGGVKPLRGKGVEAVTVVPARDSTEGMLCIEMWIRLYADGAMSKLLDKLADLRLGLWPSFIQRALLLSLERAAKLN